MRRFLAIAAALLLAAPSAAHAVAEDGASASATQTSRLDELFAELKREDNERAAERIAGRIQRAWVDSDSDTASLLMRWSKEAMEEEKFHVALDFLDQVVTLYPGYAEGWNRRATVHFMMDNYAKSMADISRTLELEPRHFGALSGMAGILKATGREEMALEAYRRVLEIYPMMRRAQSEVGRLSDALTGEGI